MAGNPFGAAPSAAGYLYQAWLALYRCIPHLKAGLDLEMSIEQLDDVAFASGGDALELLQTKHHVRRTASLETMTDILQEASQRMQVILLTCRSKAFRHVDGNRITLS